MRSTVLVVALASLTPSALAAQEPWVAHPARQVIDAEMLRAAGVRRLSDVLRLADDWAAASVDGFTWRASPRGMSTFQDQSWIVMVGRERIDLSLLGVRSLDRLPITVVQLDSVEIVSAPQAAFGQLAAGGLIRFHLRRPTPGFAVDALAETANETGDPGPFAFTELGTPNVDRIGSGVLGTVAYSSPAGFIEASGGWREHFVTDPPMRERTFAVTTGHHPIILQHMGALRAGYDLGAAGRHRLLLGRTWTRDYFFLPALRREVPAESPLTHAGVDGDLRLADGTSLRYRAAYERNDLDEQPNALGLDFDFGLERWSVAVEAARAIADMDVRLGGGLRHVVADTRFPLTDDNLQIVDLYTTLTLNGDRRVRHSLSLSLVADNAATGVRGVLTQDWRAGGGHRVLAAIAYAERVPGEDERIWFWRRRGYSFLEANGVGVMAIDGPRTARVATADARWEIPAAPRLRLAVDGYIRVHKDLTLEEADLTFDPTDATFAGPARVISGLAGELAGATLTGTWRAPLDGLSIRGRYGYQAVIGGDTLFRDAWRAVPRHRLRLSARYVPVADLTLWADVSYRGATRWTDFGGAAAASDGRYDERVDDALALDLAAQKWFWHRRLRLHLLARNVFDDAVPYHPIGAAYGLTLQAQLELLLRAR